MSKTIKTVRERWWERIAIITSCLAIGTSASVAIVNNEATARADANACALKSFLVVLSNRTRHSPQPGQTEIIKKYHRLVVTLQPELKDCPARYVIK